MAVRYVHRRSRRLNGGGRSIEEAEPPPESLEISKYLSSDQRFIKIRGCKWRSNREVVIGIRSDSESDPIKTVWLPEGWEMKCVTQTNGSSSCNRDKYYIESGIKRRQFRSKREVLEFITTGKRRQYKRKANSIAMLSTVNRPFEGTSSSSLQNIRTASHDLEASTSRQTDSQCFICDQNRDWKTHTET